MTLSVATPQSLTELEVEIADHIKVIKIENLDKKISLHKNLM